MPTDSGSTITQIIIPIYNEGENVNVVYQSLLDNDFAFYSLKFVYDFDEDDSLPFIARIHENDSRVIAEKNEYGRGVVHALKWGFKHAQPGPVIVIMGDNCDDLSNLTKIEQAWKNGATIVAPSRYMKGGDQQGGPFFKTFLSRFACISLRCIGFPTSDATNNFKLYDGAWLSQQTIESKGGFELGIELSYKAFSEGKTIVELPTVWKDRTAGESKFQLMKWMPQYMKWYLLIVREIVFRWMRLRPRRATVVHAR